MMVQYLMVTPDIFIFCFLLFFCTITIPMFLLNHYIYLYY